MSPLRAESCDRLGRHCGHWGLSDVDHAILHAQTRLIDEVYDRDMAAGHKPGEGTESSIRTDAPRLRELLAEEGYAIVPTTRLA